MGIIRILSDEVASQIAAGEVIERPSSVIRELLDNSIDAESDRITVKIERGGKKVIRVSDNGTGMSRDDLLLCTERHATSKILSISDLSSIKTLGFRGEALPSISCVSKMEISSRSADQITGYKLKTHGGRLISIDESGAPAGTTVEVNDLFFNVPVRRKFLRSDKTETDHIIDTVSRIMLPYTRISFRLDDAQKTILSLPASDDELNRLAVLIGRDVVKSMTEIHQGSKDVMLRGFLASPDWSRVKGDRIYIYINKRNIRDRLITRAILEGYGQRLMKGRYPQATVFIEIDPQLVDINVHPTKQEVRFHHGQDIYMLVESAIRKGLTKPFHYSFHTAPPIWDSNKSQPAQTVIAEPEGQYVRFVSEEATEKKNGYKEGWILEDDLQVIGQLNDTYILCQDKDALLMIDQHAAHERIIYETLKGANTPSFTEKQVFLIPYRLDLSLKDSRVLQGNLGKLVAMGLEFEHFGGNTFLLRSAPTILLDVRWEELLRDLIPLLEERNHLNKELVLDRMMISMACHGAIKAGKRLSQEEMHRLINSLKRLTIPTHCPHGRPVFWKLSRFEIERMFKRVV